MNNLKEFIITFYMTNGDIFRMKFEYDSLEAIINWLTNNIGDMTFLGSTDMKAIINIKNVNYFEIEEKEEVTA